MGGAMAVGGLAWASHYVKEPRFMKVAREAAKAYVDLYHISGLHLEVAATFCRMPIQKRPLPLLPHSWRWIFLVSICAPMLTVSTCSIM